MDISGVPLAQFVALSAANKVKTLNVSFDVAGRAVLFKFRTRKGKTFIFKTTPDFARDLANRIAGSAKVKGWKL